MPGTEVPRGTAVDITLGAPEPQLVTVPNLLGIDVDDAPSILQPLGLALGQTAGDGDVIRGQNPPAGARVPSSSAVDVSLGVESPPAPEQLVAVPDLVGDTVDEARTALADVGLGLGNDPDGDSTVESQAPAAGAPVPPGTTVTVTVDPTAVPISHATPLWPLAAGAILLGAVALVGTPAVLGRRGPRWLHRHVRIVA
jgi:eukaryotic-like serine/threonine-protein kinase